MLPVRSVHNLRSNIFCLTGRPIFYIRGNYSIFVSSSRYNLGISQTYLHRLFLDASQRSSQVASRQSRTKLRRNRIDGTRPASLWHRPFYFSYQTGSLSQPLPRILNSTSNSRSEICILSHLDCCCADKPLGRLSSLATNPVTTRVSIFRVARCTLPSRQDGNEYRLLLLIIDPGIV